MSTKVPLQEFQAFKTGELASAFKCHASTIRRWAKQGKLPARRPGGHYRFLRSDIARFIESGIKEAS